MVKGLDQRIKQILDEKFVNSEDMSRILALAFASGKNALVFGPGGHAKSEMTQHVIVELELAEDTFFQFFGEGMDEARLFGGLNFAKLENEKVLEYYPERSFLNYRVAVFEELFDAPANVLLALKDVLTAKALRNGAQYFKMRTEVIIVLTNKSPDEISELGPAAHALVERFPLQLELKWKDYSAEAYLALFDKVNEYLDGPVVNGFKKILAEIIAKSSAEGNFVSPRTAVHAYQVCQAAAMLRGADEVGQEDLVDLRFVPGLESLAETIEEDLRRALEKAEAERQIGGGELLFADLQGKLNEADTPIKALQVAKALLRLQDMVSGMKVPDALVNKRKSLLEKIAKAVTAAQAKALEVTRVDGLPEPKRGFNPADLDLEEENKPSSPFGKKPSPSPFGQKPQGSSPFGPKPSSSPFGKKS